jgi:heptosyltransferase-2
MPGLPHATDSRRVLLLELWGLGDAVLLTTVLRPLLKAGIKVTLVCKSATVELLQPSFPTVNFIVFHAPWTAFRGKYQLGSWPWRELIRTLIACRHERPDVAASVRRDPRDHLFMFLVGAANRIGFPRQGSGILLTRNLAQTEKDHRVESWREIGKAALELFGVGDKNDPEFQPYLNAKAYAAGTVTPHLRSDQPKVGLHCGASAKVRRWDENYFAQLVPRLRQEATFHLALFPDLDGYGRKLMPMADSFHENLSVPQLVARLAACDLVLSNDSGPGHIAAALGKPVLAFFGPQNPNWFRPYGEENHVVIRDICPFRPCFDYCHFPEPICLTQLKLDDVWTEVRDWFRRQMNCIHEAV